MRHEHHRGAGVAASGVDQVDDQLLIGRIETREGFVAQQERRVGGQGLCDPQALLLTTGEHPERRVGVLLGADLCQRVVDDPAPTGPAA